MTTNAPTYTVRRPGCAGAPAADLAAALADVEIADRVIQPGHGIVIEVDGATYWIVEYVQRLAIESADEALRVAGDLSDAPFRPLLGDYQHLVEALGCEEEDDVPGELLAHFDREYQERMLAKAGGAS